MSYIGIDIGRSYIKAVRQGQVLSFPTQAGSAVKLRAAPFSNGKKYHLLEPLDYFVGDLAIQQRVGDPDLSPDWVLREPYTALYLTSLAAITETFHTHYSVVTGLPISDLHLVKAIKPRMVGEFQPKIGNGAKKTIKVDDVVVVAQGIGALLSQIIDRDGNIVDSGQAKGGRAGVLDIGSKTTGIISVEGIQEVTLETGSVEAGTWKLEETVRRLIVGDHAGWGQRVSKQELMRHIIKGEPVYDLKGEIDIGGYIQDASRLVAREIVDQMTHLWSDARHLRYILVCGGGSHLFLKHIQDRYPHARAVDGDPLYANAVGYHRYGLFLGRR